MFPTVQLDSPKQPRSISIWWFALGYFACYVPYSSLSKATSRGLFSHMDGGIPGIQLLPWSTLVSLAAMVVFITTMRWWKYAGKKNILGKSLPCPNRWTFFSGVCTSAIIATTTLAYTFDGISIVFMMLLMRGGVLVIAPLVDAISRRHVRWFSWLGLALSVGALVAAFLKDSGLALTAIAIVDVAIYLASYFVRLQFMSRLSKSEDSTARIRYFVEEQMVATPLLVTFLALMALLSDGTFGTHLRQGWTSVFDAGVFGHVVLIGLFSQGTGVFGGLILLGSQENSYCVPVNRASSIFAGVIATLIIYWQFDGPFLTSYEFVGAGLIVMAIAVLALPSLLKRRPVPT